MEKNFEQRLQNAAQLLKNISEEIVTLQTLGSKPRCQRNGNVSVLQAQLLARSQQIQAMLESVFSDLKSLVNDLNSLVNEWKGRFQLHYAKLMAEPDLKEIASWCARAGKIIYELLHTTIRKWKNILQSSSVGHNILEVETSFRNLFTSFLQSTFLVSKQEQFCIKTEQKKFQTFIVRVLAADYLYELSADVSAHLISEHDLKKCFHGNTLDVEALKQKEIQLNIYKEKRSSKHELKTVEAENKMQCCVDNLQFKGSFKRQQTRDSRQLPVHEEKFRMVFITKLETETCWTMSLPLVVLSATSQDANGLASIMWQCSSTDVFSMQEGTPEKLQWSTVATMLKRKMSMLSNSRNLAEEDLTHLKYRLFGVENQPDDALVSLTQFCCNNMQGLDFSFWKWFLGIYNLIQQFMLKYWNDGLIKGFLKKEDAEKMLLTRCNRNGTFILRFSDSNIIKSEGLAMVYGYLTSSTLKNAKETGGKRNRNGECEVVKKSVDPHQIGSTKCPPKNLANELKKEKLVYCYLYPGIKSREELFDKYCEDEDIDQLAGYEIPDLEEEMVRMSIRETSRSTEASASLPLGPTEVKRPRCNEKLIETDNRSTNRQINVSPQSCVQNGSPLNWSQSPGSISRSLGSLDQSPEQFVPNPILQRHLNDLNQDSVVPTSPIRSGIPTIIEDLNLQTHYTGKEGQCENISLNKVVPCDSPARATSDSYHVLDGPVKDATVKAGADNCTSVIMNTGIKGGDCTIVGGADKSEGRRGGGAFTSCNGINEQFSQPFLDFDDQGGEFDELVSPGLEIVSQISLNQNAGQVPVDQETLQLVLSTVSQMLKPDQFKMFLSWINIDKKDDIALVRGSQNTLPVTEIGMEPDSRPVDTAYANCDGLFEMDLSQLEELLSENSVPDPTTFDAFMDKDCVNSQHELKTIT